jgi:peptidoglycan/LPS O-acetylase OafA/YrhL
MFKPRFEAASVGVRLEALQVLRAVAAMLVVFSHLLRLVHEAWTASSGIYAPALAFGECGVFCFFVLSGFIIYFTAGSQFRNQGAALRFLGKRFSRIAPLYWVFTGVTLVSPFAFGSRPAGVAGVMLSLALLPDFTNLPSFSPVLMVGWTLTLEALFYVVFAACLTLPRRFGLWTLILAFPVYLSTVVLLSWSPIAEQPWWKPAIYWARPEVLLFICGLALAMLHEQFGQVVDRHGLARGFALLAILWLPICISDWPYVSRVKVEAPVCTIVVMAFVMGSGAVWRGLKPLVALGDASYSLYLSHAFVIGGLSGLWLATAGPKAPALFVIVALCVSCAVAWLIHMGLERPLTGLAQRLLNRFSDVARSREGALA